MKIIAVNPDKCTGCRLCELACSLKNTGEFNPARQRMATMPPQYMIATMRPAWSKTVAL